MATEKELQKASEDNLAALTKKNKLITESNKVLSSVTKLETQIENSKKKSSAYHNQLRMNSKAQEMVYLVALRVWSLVYLVVLLVVS